MSGSSLSLAVAVAHLQVSTQPSALGALGVRRGVSAWRRGDSGVSGGDGPCKASASGVQRAAGGEQRAAGGWRGASSRAGQQSGVGGGPERPNKFQKFLAAQISEFILVPRFCATECWYKICTMFLVPDRVIFAGPGSQLVNFRALDTVRPGRLLFKKGT